MRRQAIILFIALLPNCVSAFDRYAGLAEAEHQASDLSKALNLIMSTATPDLYFHKREIMVEEYEKAAVNKALAVNVKSAEYWQTTDQDSKAVVSDRTLEGCQLRFGSPCKLLAVNDELAQLAGPAAEQDMSRLKYSGGFDLIQLPIVKDEVESDRTSAIIWPPRNRKPSPSILSDRCLWSRDFQPTRKQ